MNLVVSFDRASTKTLHIRAEGRKAGHMADLIAKLGRNTEILVWHNIQNPLGIGRYT